MMDVTDPAMTVSHIAGRLRVRKELEAQWRQRAPGAGPGDLSVLTDWSTRYVLAVLGNRSAPMPSRAVLAAHERLVSGQ